jgi:hypothetical protein
MATPTQTRTAGTTAAREHLLNERSTEELPLGPRVLPPELLDRLSRAAPRVQLINVLHSIPKDPKDRIGTRQINDQLFEAIRDVSALYGGTGDYQMLYQRDVEVLERWFWPQATTFIEYTITDMREALDVFQEPYRDSGTPVRSLFDDLRSWMGLISEADVRAQAADKALLEIRQVAQAGRMYEEGQTKYNAAKAAQDAHQQALGTTREFETTIHIRHALFPLIKAYLEDRGRLRLAMQRPEWSMSTASIDESQEQAAAVLVQKAVDFARVSVDQLERRALQRDWEKMTAMLRTFAVQTFGKSYPTLVPLCDEFIDDRVGLTWVDIFGLVGLAVGAAALVVATGGAASPVLLGALGAVEAAAGLAEFVATLRSHDAAAQFNRLAVWDSAWKVAEAQGDPAIAGVMVAVSLVGLVPGAKDLLGRVAVRSIKAARLEKVAAKTVDAATSLPRVAGELGRAETAVTPALRGTISEVTEATTEVAARGQKAAAREAVELPPVDEAGLPLESKLQSVERMSSTDLDRGLSFADKDVNPGGTPRGLERGSSVPATKDKKGARKAQRKFEAQQRQEGFEVEPHRADPVKTIDRSIDDFDPHNLSRASFKNPTDYVLDDIRQLLNDPANLLGLSPDEVVGLRLLDDEAWAALVRQIPDPLLDAFRSGEARAVGAIGQLKGAIQELFIPHLPAYSKAFADARQVIQKLGLGIPDSAVTFSKRITDASGRQLTDGLVYAVHEDRCYIFSVFEAKSKTNLQDVARTRFGKDEVADFINHGQVESSLRRLETNSVIIDGRKFEPSRILLGPDAGYRTTWYIVAPKDGGSTKVLDKLKETLAEQGRKVEVVTSPLRNSTYGQLARRILALLSGG